MFKFGITLCLLFIFVYTAESRRGDITKNLYDTRISSLIKKYLNDYNNADKTTSDTLKNISEKLEQYRRTKSAEIIKDFQEKQIEADALISAVSGFDPADCLIYISDLDKTMEKATNTVRECLDIQCGAIEGNYTKIQDTLSKALKGIETFKQKAHDCHSDNTVASNKDIIGCLRPIKRKLLKYELVRPNFDETIEALEFWLRNFDGLMEACASKNLNIYYGNSSTLITTVEKCIKTKASVKKSSAPVT